MKNDIGVIVFIIIIFIIIICTMIFTVFLRLLLRLFPVEKYCIRVFMLPTAEM